MDIISLSEKFDVTLDALNQYLNSLNDHIRYVREAGRRLGVPARQLHMHDDSKFSDDEFPFYAKHFHGGGDPARFAVAWLHHLQHNPHHWQHWIFPDGFTPKGSTVENGVVQMPEHYALEMIADWYGASMAYTKSWDMTDWLEKNIPRIRLHSKTAQYVLGVLKVEGHGDVLKRQQFAHEVAAAKES